jgi:predicted nucleic acid-binding protein
MNKYLLDTNVVIGLWKHYPSVIEKLIEDEKIVILKEVSQELVVKERKEYKGQQVLSERFCKLLLFMIEVDRKNIEEFYSILDIKYSKKGNAYLNGINKLSQNDLLLLYSCYIDNNLMLVTEDKYLFNTANHILAKNRVMTLKMLVESIIEGDANN